MELHPNAKQQMLAVLSENLKHVAVKNGKFLDRVSSFVAFYRANEVLPKRGKLAESLDYWIEPTVTVTK